MSARGCTCSRAVRYWQPDGVCRGCGQRVLEEQLTPVLLQTLCAPGSGLVLWRNTRGFDAYFPDGTKRKQPIRYGVGDGGADYLGIGPDGRFVGVEFKSATGRQQPNQIEWQRLVERLGGVYEIVRSPDDAQAFLARMRGGSDR